MQNIKDILVPHTLSECILYTGRPSKNYIGSMELNEYKNGECSGCGE